MCGYKRVRIRKMSEGEEPRSLSSMRGTWFDEIHSLACLRMTGWIGSIGLIDEETN